MTNPDRPLNVRPLKHISLVANNLGVVQADIEAGKPSLILRSGVKPRLEGWASGEIRAFMVRDALARSSP
jgi:hypothetical protein